MTLTPALMQFLFWLSVVVLTILLAAPTSLLLNTIRFRLNLIDENSNLLTIAALALHNLPFALGPGVILYFLLQTALPTVPAAMIAYLVATAAGAIIVWRQEQNATGRFEFPNIAIYSALTCIVVVPVAGWFITNSFFQKAAYERLVVKQLYHGTVIDAQMMKVQTSFDGQDFEAYYDCAPYDCNCDDDGCSTCWRRCPFTDYEEQYQLTVYWGTKSDGSPRLETVNLWGNQLPANPEEHRWRLTQPEYDISGKNGEYNKTIPSNILSTIGVGIPAGWARYQEALAEEVYLPFNSEKEFENPLMASDSDLWVTQGPAVTEFLALDLLPDIQRVPNDGRVNLIYTVGLSLPVELQNALSNRLEEFNAAFGAERQGDLRIVFVGDPAVGEHADEYLPALKAHWSNPDTQGDYILPKNNLTLAFFTTDPESTGRARAFTAMPFGNEALLKAINEQGMLDDLPTDPNTLFGRVTATLNKDGDQIFGVRYRWEEGVLSRLLWGKDQPELAFVRYSMSENFPDFWKWVKPTPKGLVEPGVFAIAWTGLAAVGTSFLAVPVILIRRLEKKASRYD